MIDYTLQVIEFDEEKVTSEMERLTELLMSTNPNSTMYSQMLNMFDALQNRHQEILYVKNNKFDDKPLDIGVMEETVVVPDYSSAELLNAVVTQYTDITPGDKNE